MKHFYYYPSIEYGGDMAINIMVRAKIRDVIIQKASLYYKYRIPNGTRPDVVSTKYYGNPTYTWAIFYANNIFNPLHEWPMEEQAFGKYLEIKYGMSYARGPLDAPHHYELYDTATKETLIIDENTYRKEDKRQGILSVPKTVREVSLYQYEFELNESKRDIVVLEKRFLSEITNEFDNLF